MGNFSSVLQKAWQYKVRLAVILVIILVGIIIFSDADETELVTEEILPVVTVSTPARLTGEQEISVVGTVRALDEATITAEASGQVTSVNARLGQTVPAGFVIATLENASERAAVIQAEGSYEAALAAASQSDVGVDEARTGLRNSQNNALSTFDDAYNTVNGVVQNNIDTFFANPDSRLPGLKIDGRGNTPFLNSERVAFQTLLSTWQSETLALTTDSDLALALENASSRVDRTIALIDIFITLFNENDSDNSYTEAELLAFSSTFTSLRATLQGTNTAINNSLAALENAVDRVRRAEISATGSQTSAADAQVKQALGSLRSAQANLAKTILRTPISGTVNSLNIRVGDFVGNQDVITRIANNNALEIVTFVGDNELPAFSVGNTVIIEDSFEGTVTEVAPAVDPVTRKTEVRITIETEEIQNGDTVTISTVFASDTSVDQPIIIPLAAVKFEIEDGFVFTVVDNRLVTQPVELGFIRGGSVEIVSGLETDEEFVLDARGLLADTEVEVRTR